MPQNRWVLGGLAVAWFGVVLLGFKNLQGYKVAQGSPGSPPAYWPSASKIVPVRFRPTLVFFAHPKCPCTRASLDELAWILTRLKDKVPAHIVYFMPSDLKVQWGKTGLMAMAENIPGAVLHEDLDGLETRRFQVKTSGHVLVYDGQGRLIFSGGITGSRGHPGANAGRQAVLSLLAEGKSVLNEAPVFGCSLLASMVDPNGLKELYGKY